MTLPLIIHELAESELNEAAAYYARARPRLGNAFLGEVQHALEALAASPLAAVAVEKERDVRWWPVSRFPYAVLYRPCADHIRILAIAHHRRRPFYWRERL